MKQPLKLYLDNSFLNRPFDDYSVLQNKLEAEILFLIIDLINKNKIILVNSAIIEYENSLNPFIERQIFVKNLLNKAKVYQNLDNKILQEAAQIIKKFKISPSDALHLACATITKVDYFITCDYNLIRKFRGEKPKVISPLEFLKIYK